MYLSDQYTFNLLVLDKTYQQKNSNSHNFSSPQQTLYAHTIWYATNKLTKKWLTSECSIYMGFFQPILVHSFCAVLFQSSLMLVMYMQICIEVSKLGTREPL